VKSLAVSRLGMTNIAACRQIHSATDTVALQ